VPGVRGTTATCPICFRDGERGNVIRIPYRCGAQESVGSGCCVAADAHTGRPSGGATSFRSREIGGNHSSAGLFMQFLCRETCNQKSSEPHECQPKAISQALSLRGAEREFGSGDYWGLHMLEPRPAVPHQPDSSQVLLRFVVRLILVITVASFSTQAFGAMLAALLALSGIFCSVMGLLRHESIFGPVLTHWDEAAACAILSRLAGALS
jgi:hypothetical protein